jgi:hypothetical protein
MQLNCIVTESNASNSNKTKLNLELAFNFHLCASTLSSVAKNSSRRPKKLSHRFASHALDFQKPSHDAEEAMLFYISAEVFVVLVRMTAIRGFY